MASRIHLPSPAGRIVRGNRRRGTTARGSSFRETVMCFPIFVMAFLLVDFHPSSNNFGDAFVVNERSVIRQRCDHRTIVSRTAPPVPETTRGRIALNNSPFGAEVSRRTMLFDSTVTEQEVDTSVSQGQDSLESTSTASNASIDVVIPNGGVQSSSSSSKNANGMSTDDKAALLGKMKKKSVEKDGPDVPQPTENGGFTHTNASRAKISAANKGKTPWNKGKPRSPEVRARIAAGVRARNREVFLKKLADLGMTEEEYEAKKKEEKRKKEADRRARRTANGGYRPTEETKKKISRILKEKHAKGEVKPRAKTDPSKVRKGFTHSEETRRKISESLRKRWRSDEGFQKKMKDSITSRETARKRISESLKKKWQDPDFRREMMDKMAKRKSGKNAMSYDEEHRKKISEAMKRKWKDSSYREKTLSSIKKSAESRRVASPKKTSAKPKKKSTAIEELQPMTAIDVSKRKTTKKRVTRKKSVTKSTVKKVINDDDDDDDDDVTLVEVVNTPKTKGATSTSSKLENEDEPPKEKKKKKKKEKDGSVSRLREERRDLFDLLYGDEDDLNDDDDDDIGKLLSDSSSSKVDIILGDEDLDAFDPYGLDDY